MGRGKVRCTLVINSRKAMGSGPRPWSARTSGAACPHPFARIQFIRPNGGGDMAYASRLLILSSLLFSGVAEAKCPERFDGPPAAWGAPTAVSGNDRLYEPVGLRLFGRNVSYVTVTGDENQRTLEFRLAEEVRGWGNPLSQSLRDAFTKNYSKVECSQSNSACFASVPTDDDDSSSQLFFVRVEYDFEHGGSWQGAGARLITADKRLQEEGLVYPVYLGCDYGG